MSRRPGVLVSALVALTVLVFAAPAGAAARQVPWAGVMVDGPVIEPTTDYDDQWTAMRAAHLGNVRLAFYWPQLEPFPGGFDFTPTDNLVAKAAGSGLQVLPVVLRTPEWAAKNRKKDGSPPKKATSIQPLMKALIARYGPAGTFWTEHPEFRKLPLRDWQVYNEPELKPYWNDKRWAKGYVKVLAAANKAIKSADPGARTILAGLTNQSWADLAQVYKAGGRKHFDAAALHIYTSDAKGVGIVAKRARQVMKRNGDKRKPIWLTEVTWPSSKGKRPGARPWETSERGQAQKVRKGLPALARLRKKLKIDKVVWYSWLTVEDRTTWQTYSGLLRLRKGKVVAVPAFKRFADALKRLAG